MADDFKIPEIGTLLGKDQYQLSKLNGLAENAQKLQAATASGKANAASSAEQKKAAEQFEALLLQQMMGAMWQTVPKGGLLTGGNEERYYRDMLSEALANNVSKGQGIGIKDVVLREFKKQDK